MKLYPTALIALTACLTAALPASAQESQSQKIGRLRDGRAFRVDPNGVQLVDQLAELEVTVDELKRQVAALQDELEERRKGCPATGSISEESIVSPGKAKTSAAAAQAPKTSEHCSELTAPLQARTAELEEQLKSQRASLELQCSKILSDAQGGTNEAKAEQSRLAKRVEELEHALEQSHRAAEDLEIQLANRGPVPAPRSRQAVQPRLQTETVQESSVSVGRFKPRLQQIQQMINERKDLLDAARSGRKGVSVSIRPLTTAQGSSLDSIRARLSAGALAGEEAIGVDAALTEIEDILRGDIQVLRRLSKL